MTRQRCLLIDWGDTAMRVLPGVAGPMHDWATVEAIPGAAAALRDLRTEYVVALATNAVDSDEEAIRKALRRVDLEGAFDSIFCQRNLGSAKPSVDFFRAILDEVSLPPSAMFMVGDNFEVDILGANAAGIRGVWFNEFSSDVRESPMRTTIHHFAELSSALARLSSSLS